MYDLKSLRQSIDAIDQNLLKLLSERGGLAKAIGKIKEKQGKAIFNPAREQAIYDRLARLNKGPYRDEALFSIFREIISATRALEAPIKVSFLGPEATFTHMAGVRHFGSSAQMIPEAGIQNVFSEVERGHTDFGVVPIENSTEGVVSHTLDLFVDSPLQICSEVILRISHQFLSRESSLSKIKTVYSHPQALAQCRQWILAHVPQAKLKEVESTAMAAKKAKSEKGSAAIASELAASHYGLNILESEVQDYSQNFTRFLVIGKHQPDATNHDKTSVLFVAKDHPGVLFKILEPVSRAKINLTKIESRPLKKKVWEYMFFMDLDGHINDPKLKGVLEKVKKQCTLFKIMGSYPKSRNL